MSINNSTSQCIYLETQISLENNITNKLANIRKVTLLYISKVIKFKTTLLPLFSFDTNKIKLKCQNERISLIIPIFYLRYRKSILSRNKKTNTFQGFFFKLKFSSLFPSVCLFVDHNDAYLNSFELFLRS